jgi:hypothetical protein
MSLKYLVAIGFFSVSLLTACSDKIDPQNCNVPATVRDLSGLDGCGKVLELTNGKRLEPFGSTWTSFPSTDGQRVLIGYQPAEGGSICMVGAIVTITCIRADE